MSSYREGVPRTWVGVVGGQGPLAPEWRAGGLLPPTAPKRYMLTPMQKLTMFDKGGLAVPWIPQPHLFARLIRFGKMLPYNQDAFDAGKCNNAGVSLDDAIKSCQDFLLSQQFPDGYWWADLETNVSLTSETVLLFKILRIDSKYPVHKMENYIRQQQRAHGGWEIFYGDGGDLSMTIEAYMALRLLDVPRSDPALQKAYTFIINKGGITRARVFTKICLCLLGCFDWNALPSLPPWVVLLPSWFVSSIYEMASWSRSVVVPLLVVFDKKPVFKVTPEICLDEVYAEGRKYAPTITPLRGNITDVFVLIDRLLKKMERVGYVPFRQLGIKAAEKWVLERQDETGEWGGIFPAMFFSIVCLLALGYKVTDPVVYRGLLGVESFSIETTDTYHMQACISPVWDTALIVRALVESGIASDHPALHKAGEWLLTKQIIHNGDWSFKSKAKCCGGWAFEFSNRWYPDVDDTAVVAMALNRLKLPNEGVKHGAIAQAVRWISSMQCKGGGWAAFDKDNDQEWLDSIPFNDLNGMRDPNTADVTARVLEMVGELTFGGIDDIVVAALPPLASMQKGLAYLKKVQEKEGCWFGRWGVNFIYGTCGVLVAMALISPSAYRNEIAKGARWLVEVQNMQDKSSEGYGGWGETCRSYEDSGLKGRPDASTPSQTAWAVIGLLAAGDALGKFEAESIEHGVRYLLRTQRRDGSWHEAHFTGTGFPGHFYLRYHYYAQHFPLTALSRYRARQHKLYKQQLVIPALHPCSNGKC